jgi:hypothetical protein
VFSAALAALAKWWGGLFANFEEWLLRILDITVSLVVIP